MIQRSNGKIWKSVRGASQPLFPVFIFYSLEDVTVIPVKNQFLSVSHCKTLSVHAAHTAYAPSKGLSRKWP